MEKLRIVTFLLAIPMLFFTSNSFSDTNLPPDATYNSGSNPAAHFTVTATPTTLLTVNDNANISATGGVSIDTTTYGNGTVTFQGNSTVSGTVGASGLNIGTVNANGASGKNVTLQNNVFVSNLDFGGGETVTLDGGSFINSINTSSSGSGTISVNSPGYLNIYTNVGSSLLPISAIDANVTNVTFNNPMTVYANNLGITNGGSFTFADGVNYTGTGVTADGTGTLTFNGSSTVNANVGAGGSNVGSIVAGTTNKTDTFQGNVYASTLHFSGNGIVALNGGSFINSITTAGAGSGTIAVDSNGFLNVYAGVGSALLPINAINTTADNVHFNNAINIYANNLGITSGGSFTFDDGANYTGTGITTTDSTGTLTFNGASTISAAVGTGVSPIGIIDANGVSGKTLTLQNNVYANNLNFGGSETVSIAGTSTLGSVTGGIGTLEFGANNTIAVNGALNTGAVTTSGNGNGTLTLTGGPTISCPIGALGASLNTVNITTAAATLGNHIYATNTNVNGGGSITLNGSQAINGTVNLQATGSLNLGNNTLTNNGTYNQAANTTLSLTANSATDFGKINTTGNAAVTAGSTVNVAVGGYISNGSTLDIINGAALSAYGSPATINSSDQRISFSSSSSNGEFFLIASRSGTGYASLAANSNAAAAGSTLDNVSNPSPAMQSVLNTLDSLPASQISSGLNTLTPIVDNSSPQVSYQTQNQFIQIVATHLEDVNNPGSTGISTGDADLDCLSLRGLDIWAQGLGSYLHEDPRGLSNGYNATVWGVALGADYPVTDNIRLGISGGFAQDFVNSKDNSATNDVNNYNGTLYGAYTKDQYYIDLATSFAYNTYDASRQIAIGTLSYTPTADFNGQEYSCYIEGGYTFNIQKFALTPLASFEYAHLHIADYTETGAGVLD